MSKASKKTITENQFFVDAIAEINKITTDRGWDQSTLKCRIEEFSNNKSYRIHKERLSQLSRTELVGFLEWYKAIGEKSDPCKETLIA